MKSKLIGITSLIAMMILVACSGAEATPTPQPTTPPPAPTATPEPTATPLPTATQEPAATKAPEPTATPAPPAPEKQPEPDGSMAQITPVRLDNPLALASQVSEPELACLAGVADMAQLMQMLSATDQVPPEEQAKLIGCLEHETLLGMVVANFIDGPDPLSVETSACIRMGMQGIDLAVLMLPSDDQAAMQSGMNAMFVTFTCLNEDEWARVAPGSGFTQQDREGMQCLAEDLGGPEGLAQILASDDETALFAVIGAAMECGLQIGGPPQGMAPPEPTATPMPDPTATPAPTATPEPTATASVPDQVTGVEPITPIHLDNPLGLMSVVSESELACLTGAVDQAQLMLMMTAPDQVSPEDQAKIIGCFEDETQLGMVVAGFIDGPDPLSVETSACIRMGIAGVDLSALMASSGDQAAMQEGMTAMFVVFTCLNEDEWERVSAGSGFTSEDRENFQCVIEQLGGPEGFAQVLAAEDDAAFFAVLGAAMECGLQLGAPPPG